VTRIRIHGRVLEAKLVKRVLPDYPKSACEAGVAGTVHFLVRTDKSGAVRATKVIDGDSRFNHAAESAVKQWKYRPTLVNGNRVEVETNIYVRFLFSPR
jgi:protein TonB